MSVIRRMGALFVATGALLLAALAAGASPSAATPVYNAALKAAHVGATNPGFQAGECPEEGWGWHFVLPGNSTTFVAVKATFENAGDITAFTSFPTGKHAYVYTPGPDTLLAAVAEVDGPQHEFNLSHVCTGPTTTTSTTEPTTSTTEPTTSTTEPTTSTTEPTTSTTEPTTSTTEPTTSTTVPTTSTTEPTTSTTTSTTSTTQPTGSTTTTEPPESTTTTGPPPTSEETTTTQQAVVLPEQVNQRPDGAARASTLPRTGSEVGSLGLVGAALLAFGAVSLATSIAVERRRSLR